ncbi:LysR family transcriptional regulator [Pseudomonas sp. Marseille-QA0892]
MDKLLAMRWFVEVTDSQGFSAAARKLGVATSSVTRLMDALEADLQTPLMNRSTRQVSLTEAGLLYVEQARAILESVDAMDRHVRDQTGEPTGPLHVSIASALGRVHLAPYLAAFLSQYPHIDLRVELSDDLSDLFNERVDVAVRLGSPSVLDALICQPLGNFKRVVVASPAYLAESGSPMTPDDLLRHACLTYRYGDSVSPWNFSRDGHTQRVDVQSRLKSNSAELLKTVALGGGGIALLADWLVRDALASGSLVQLLTPYEAQPGQASSAISALYLPNRRGSRRVKAFLDFWRAHVSSSDTIRAASGKAASER